MTLQEYVAAFCPDGPAQLRRLIMERTGVQLPYAYVWKWCNPHKPCSVSIENAVLIHTATQGQCSMEELQSLKTIRSRSAGAAAPARQARRKKVRKRAQAKPAKRRDAAGSKLQKRVAELERQLAALRDAAPETQCAE